MKYDVITSNLGGTRPTVVCSMISTLDSTKYTKYVCVQPVALLSTPKNNKMSMHVCNNSLYRIRHHKS